MLPALWSVLLLLAVSASSAPVRDFGRGWETQTSFAASRGAPRAMARDPAEADPTLPVPGKLCSSTQLFSLDFRSYDTHRFQFGVPEKCLQEGHTRILLDLQCNVSAGRQFDRSIYISIGGALVFAGTTQEPSNRTAPEWHAQADLTSFYALLSTNASQLEGSVQLGTIVNDKYNGVPFCRAELQLYSAPTPRQPDLIIPFGTGKTQLTSGPISLPTNASNAYLILTAQGQLGDEFWWSCVPDEYAQILESCPGGAYRHLNVTVGTVSVYMPLQPYLFSGGVDPYLWRPILAPQTLHLLPHILPLPVGFFDTSAPTTIEISVGPTPNSYTPCTSVFFCC